MPPMIRSEFRKLSTVRSPWLLLLCGPLIVIAGISGLIQSGGNVHDPAMQARALAHVGLAALLTLIFGLLAVAGEYRHATITDTYLSYPRRGRVIGAKLAVYALVGAAAGLVSSAVAIGVTAAWLAARGGSFQISASDTWLTLAGGVAANVAFAVIGVGVGAPWPAGCRSTPARLSTGPACRPRRRACSRSGAAGSSCSGTRPSSPRRPC